MNAKVAIDASKRTPTGFPACARRYRPWPASVLLAILAWPGMAPSYPLDGQDSTGIRRLEAQQRVEAGTIAGRRQPAGGLWSLAQVDIRLQSYPDFRIPPPDPAFTNVLVRLLGDRSDHYQFAVLDVSDPAHPRYAEHSPDSRNNVGSVAKLIVMLALFQALADIYPDDTAKRLAILKDTLVVADDLVLGDDHSVKVWNAAEQALAVRKLRPGDTASLWEFADWTVSASSNAAASALMKQVMMMNHFGATYPPAVDVDHAFFSSMPKADLGSLMRRSLDTPLTRSGFDVEQIRQGSFFTRKGHDGIPTPNSYATPRTLLEYLVRLEQGRLVDPFSSREIKRLMYATERRIRYASSPALDRSAVYFKSGSLYSCKPEPEFRCAKYKGNVKNYMTSVAIVEGEQDGKPYHYLVALTSNVLRRNSAVDHQTLATGFHEFITTGAVTTATSLARTEAELERDRVVDEN